MSKYSSADQIDLALATLGADAPAVNQLQVVWQVYQSETGEILDNPPSEDQRRTVHDWIERMAWNGPCLFIKSMQWKNSIYLNMLRKASTLSQMGCQVCRIQIEPDGIFPLHVQFYVDFKPWSAQSRKDKAHLKQAVIDKLREMNQFKKPEVFPWAGGPVCVTVISVVPRRAKIKDVDNLVKGLLDTMSGIVYSDDSLIQCLTSRRLEYAGDVGFYFVSVRAVEKWDSDIIFDSPKPPIFR
ncbi:Holliday junction resolvase RusA-like endonuclease [Mycobacteroides chelonae]|nr:Holliday junction resolvase RusA-like endonuclease [Mycobacteroides chelonae]